MRARLIGLVGSLIARAVFACPDCQTARLTRASVFEARFWPTLVAIVAPLLILGAMCALLYRIGMER